MPGANLLRVDPRRPAGRLLDRSSGATTVAQAPATQRMAQRVVRRLGQPGGGRPASKAALIGQGSGPPAGASGACLGASARVRRTDRAGQGPARGPTTHTGSDRLGALPLGPPSRNGSDRGRRMAWTAGRWGLDPSLPRRSGWQAGPRSRARPSPAGRRHHPPWPRPRSPADRAAPAGTTANCRSGLNGNSPPPAAQVCSPGV